MKPCNTCGGFWCTCPVEPTPAPAEPKLPGHIRYEPGCTIAISSYLTTEDPPDDVAAYIERGRYTADDLEAIARHLRTIKPATGETP